MFDLGWTELLVIGVVALIVVGPKDLPVLFRNLGRLTGRARAMAREFTDAMNDAADQAGVSDIQKTMRAAANPKTYGVETLRENIDFSSKATPEEAAEAKADSTPAPAPKPASDAQAEGASGAPKGSDT